jgi:hypothetical protein
MSEGMRERLTFANVMSVIAVFIALGGSAFAAALAKNSVGAKQIKTDAVRSAEIKSGAVGTAELADGSVSGAKIAPSVLSFLNESCPSGMTPLSDVACFDSADREASATDSWSHALNTCASAGLRLPTPNELYLASNDGLFGTASDVSYWSGDIQNTDASDSIEEAIVLLLPGTFKSRSVNLGLYFRCATSPSQG